jgi:hypothetical protein
VGPVHDRWRRSVGLFSRELRDRGAEACGGPRGGGRDDRERRLGHAADEGIGRVLDEACAAGGVDGGKAGGTVVQAAGQDDSDGAWSPPPGGTTEQRVDGGSGPVLFRCPAQQDPVIAYQQVAIGQGDVDPSGLQPFTGRRRDGRQRAAPLEDPGQGGARVRRPVQHRQHGSRKIRRQPGDHGP